MVPELLMPNMEIMPTLQGCFKENKYAKYLAYSIENKAEKQRNSL